MPSRDTFIGLLEIDRDAVYPPETNEYVPKRPPVFRAAAQPSNDSVNDLVDSLEASRVIYCPSLNRQLVEILEHDPWLLAGYLAAYE
jgi:hypothetical protein